MRSATCCLIGLLIAALSLNREASAAGTASKPNIIVILADDFGSGSLGCYGATGLKTPNLDRLAHEGRRFTQAYAPGSVCSPTRYALMTGRYYWRTSVKDGEVLPGNAPLHFDTTRLSLGSLCKGQGYRTAAIGKWHLGLGLAKQTDWNAPLTPGPLKVGFDYFYGLAANVLNAPNAYIDGETLLGRIPGKVVAIEGVAKNQKTLGVDPQRVQDEVTRRLTENAVTWIEQNHATPFFLYFTPNAIHEPVTPAPEWKGTSPFGVYGDFIHELDGSVGRMLDTLDRLKLADNTLIVFTSDNGGVVNPNNPNASGAIKAGLAINGALRGGKHDIWEGGFREPFLVRWPGKVPAGTVCDDIVSISDVLATLAGILGVPLPRDAAEDSFDASASWLGSGTPARDFVVLQDAHATYAIRQGHWKLVEREKPPAFTPRSAAAAKKIAAARNREAKQDELFNVATDPAETTDVHTRHPEIVTRLRALLASTRNAGRSRP
jgi:arylsulfatase A-like enzyme